MSKKLSNRYAATVDAPLVCAALAVFLLCAVLAVSCVLDEGFVGRRRYSIAMDFRNAAFQRVRQTNLSEIHFYDTTVKDGVVVREYGAERVDIITNLCQIGPVKLAWTNAMFSDPVMIGTNSVRAGMRLYDSLLQRELGTVLQVDSDHWFSEDAPPGVLVRLEEGGTAWLKREQVSKLLYTP